MRLLLTGATGFIGSHLAREMVTDGCEVHALVRPGSDSWRIQDILPRLNLVKCDLFSPHDVERSLETIRPDHCVHLAWCAEPGTYLTSLDNLRFLSASLHLATRLVELGCKRFIGAGTCAEYDPVPAALLESHRTVSRSLYAAAKLGLLLTLEQLGRSASMEVAWTRIFYLYGPFEDERRLVPMVIRKLLRNEAVELTTGEQIRDFSHVEDVATAIWAVTRSSLVGPVNIGSGRPVTVRDLVSTIGKILERPLLLKFGCLPHSADQPPSIYADNSRLRGNTTWASRFSQEQGLRHTVNWWKARLSQPN